MFDDKHRSMMGTIVGVCLAGTVFGCSAGGGSTGTDEYTPDGVGLEQHSTLSFEEFRAQVRNWDVDYELYVVEGDIPIRSEADLRLYYDERVAGTTLKSTAHGTSAGKADRWLANEQLGAKYCVSNAFGAGKQLMIDGMRGAVLAWQQLGNMWYRYDPTADASCSQTDSLPAGYTFKVSPWSTSYSCSFFPYEQALGCVASSVVYTLTAADGLGGDDNPLPDVIKVLTHEMGHTLGLAHENSRDEYATISGCLDTGVVDLTGFDSNSIMEGGSYRVGTTDTPCPHPSDPSKPSPLDGQGLRNLYGASAADIMVTGAHIIYWL